jgi:hypothetical protein
MKQVLVGVLKKPRGGGGVVVVYEQRWGQLHKKEGSNLEALNNFEFLGFINSK